MSAAAFRSSLLIVSVAVAACGQPDREKKEKEDKAIVLKKDTVQVAVQTDSVSPAQNINERPSSLASEESEFLKKAIDARMMGILEGKAAVKKSSSQAIKNYGALMIKDQNTMLQDLRKIMHSLSVVIPDTISESKRHGLTDLLQKDSEKFDRKFLRMMRIDHRRDVRLFSNAKDFENKQVKAFAARYLPMIEGHLEKIKDLRKAEQEKKKSRKKI